MQKKLLIIVAVAFVAIVGNAYADFPTFKTSEIRKFYTSHLESGKRQFVYKDYKATLSVDMRGDLLPKTVDKSVASKLLKKAPTNLKPVIYSLLTGTSLEFFIASVKKAKNVQAGGRCPFQPGKAVGPVIKRMYKNRDFDWHALQFMLGHRAYFEFKNKSYKTLYAYLAAEKGADKKLSDIKLSDLSPNKIKQRNAGTIGRHRVEAKKATYDVKLGRRKGTLTIAIMSSSDKKKSEKAKSSKKKKAKKSSSHKSKRDKKKRKSSKKKRRAAAKAKKKKEEQRKRRKKRVARKKRK